MLRKEQSPAAGGSTPDSVHRTRRDGSPSLPQLKWKRTLLALLERSGSADSRTWLNRFLAERLCGDHTLPSTVSELERTKGLCFERTEIEVAGYSGEPARLTAYRIAPASLQRARELLGLSSARPAS